MDLGAGGEVFSLLSFLLLGVEVFRVHRGMAPCTGSPLSLAVCVSSLQFSTHPHEGAASEPDGTAGVLEPARDHLPPTYHELHDLLQLDQE